MNPSDLNWFKISALLSGERTLRASVCRRDGSWGCKLFPSNALPAPHSLCKVVLHGPQVLFSQNCLPLTELVMGVGALWGGVDSTANNSGIHSRGCHFEVLPHYPTTPTHPNPTNQHYLKHPLSGPLPPGFQICDETKTKYIRRLFLRLRNIEKLLCL